MARSAPKVQTTDIEEPENAPMPEPTIALTPSQLQDLIAGAIAKAVPPVPSDGAALVETLATALRGMQVRRIISPGERGEPKTHFNPTGNPHRLTRVYYQNMQQLRHRGLTDEECARLEQLQEGVYCQGRFRVTITGEGSATPEVHIMWSNKAHQDRGNISREYRDFAGILKAILEDQAAQAQERADFSEFRRLKALPVPTTA